MADHVRTVYLFFVCVIARSSRPEVNFFKDWQIARARGASAIFGLWENLLVLVYYKLQERNHVITNNIHEKYSTKAIGLVKEKPPAIYVRI